MIVLVAAGAVTIGMILAGYVLPALGRLYARHGQHDRNGVSDLTTTAARAALAAGKDARDQRLTPYDHAQEWDFPERVVLHGDLPASSEVRHEHGTRRVLRDIAAIDGPKGAA